VLAGGRSTRFGRDKLSEPYEGMPLLHHAVLRLAAVCGDVVVVLAPGADGSGLPPGTRAVHDETEGEGPLAGLHAGLLAAARSDLALLAGGDMPDMSEALLREMLRVAEERGADAVALREGDTLRPLPCVLRCDRGMDRSHSLLHAGRRSLGDLLDSMVVVAIEEAAWQAIDPSRRTLFDVDEPGDLVS
jgi:molybdenum cofactor guanylyltransferase